MQITFAWQVYNNYDDVLLSSEIIDGLNNKLKYFSNVWQISQGGFNQPPTKAQSQYINKHFDIQIDEKNILISQYKKHVGILRLVKGYANAFKYSENNKSDYLIVSNADSCILDLKPIYKILKSIKMQESCIGIRKGFISGLDFNSGSYAPFFDDHFIIFNVKQCIKYKIFEYENLNFIDNTLIDFYGIHYFIKCFLDERVPSSKVYEYTNLLDSVNHYGEPSGSNLLPLQFQKELKLLHANTSHNINNNIDILRAHYFKLYKLNKFESVKKYVDKFLKNKNVKINKKFKFPYFKKKMTQSIKIYIYLYLKKIFNSIRILLIYRRLQNNRNTVHQNYNPLIYYKLNKHIIPINITGREK